MSVQLQFPELLLGLMNQNLLYESKDWSHWDLQFKQAPHVILMHHKAGESRNLAFPAEVIILISSTLPHMT